MFKTAIDQNFNSYSSDVIAKIPVVQILPAAGSGGSLVYLEPAQTVFFTNESESWIQLGQGVTPSDFSDTPIIVAVPDGADTESYLLVQGSGVNIVDGGEGSTITISAQALSNSPPVLMAYPDTSYNLSQQLVPGAGINFYDNGASNTFVINKNPLENEFVTYGGPDQTLLGSSYLTAGEGIAINVNTAEITLTIDGTPAPTNSPYITWEEDTTDLDNYKILSTEDSNIVINHNEPQINGTLTIDTNTDIKILTMNVISAIVTTLYASQIQPQYVASDAYFACYTTIQIINGTFDSGGALQPAQVENSTFTPGADINFYQMRVGRMVLFVYEGISYQVGNPTPVTQCTINLPLQAIYNFIPSTVTLFINLLLWISKGGTNTILVTGNSQYLFTQTQNQGMLDFTPAVSTGNADTFNMAPGSFSYITNSDYAT